MVNHGEPIYLSAVENMRQGMSARLSALDAMRRIVSKLPDFVGAVIAMDVHGKHGAACHKLNGFPYCHRNESMTEVEIVKIDCTATLAELQDVILEEVAANSQRGVYFGIPTLLALFFIYT